MELTERNQIKLLLEGDHSAFEVIYKQHRSEFISWIRNSFTISDADAKELYQESCMQLYKNIMSRKLTMLSGSIKTYLFGIGKNKAMELLRRNSRESDKKSNYTMENEGTDLEEETNHAHITVMMNCMDSLGDSCKRILNSFYFLGMSMELIAENYDYKNAATVKNLKYKCIKQLKSLFHSTTKISKT